MVRKPARAATTSTEPAGLPGSVPLKRSFPPVADGDTRLIVLGSLPGEQSLARGRYYAHPRNQFWALMSGVVGTDLVPLGYQERLRTLLRAGVGLWDTVASATREGSLDAAIRNHSPNALPELAARLPKLRGFAFNGGKSAAVGRKALGDTPLRLIQLPSSSPAYTLPFAEKQAAWLKLRDLL
jgi:double-stranded uracil-DNA glycosylase